MEHFNLTKKLHTDVLEDKYGPVHSEVLRHDHEVREVNISDAKNICRTYAVTFFSFDQSNSELAQIDQEIQAGGLIGKTFRDHGYEIRKNVISVFVMDLPEQIRSAMHASDLKAKARVAEFYAKKENAAPIIYGIVTEVYSPDFRPAEVNEADRRQDNPLTAAMERAGITKQQIWEHLGKDNDFSDLSSEMGRARMLAQPEENALVRKLIEYVSTSHA